MALPAHLKRKNIRRSFFKVIAERFQSASFPTSDPGRYVGKVGYSDPLFDPTAIDVRNTSLQRFVLVRALGFGVGKKLPNLFQVDLFTRVGVFDQSASGDRYSDDLDDMVDDFKGIWYPSDCGFKIFDYAVPAAPTDTGLWMISQVADGRGYGMPSDESEVSFDRGLWSISLTYSMWHVNDMQAQPWIFNATGGQGDT